MEASFLNVSVAEIITALRICIARKKSLKYRYFVNSENTVLSLISSKRQYSIIE